MSIHALATFESQEALLAGMRSAVSWVKLDDEEAMRALRSPATHVYLADGYVHRIDTLTLEQAREVIVRLCDDLEVERHKKDNSDERRLRP